MKKSCCTCKHSKRVNYKTRNSWGSHGKEETIQRVIYFCLKSPPQEIGHKFGYVLSNAKILARYANYPIVRSPYGIECFPCSQREPTTDQKVIDQYDELLVKEKADKEQLKKEREAKKDQQKKLAEEVKRVKALKALEKKKKKEEEKKLVKRRKYQREYRKKKRQEEKLKKMEADKIDNRFELLDIANES